MTKLPVLILAGSREGERDPLARLGGVTHKALLPVQGIAMIERVVNALEQVPDLGPIWVSIENPDCLDFLSDRVRFLPAASSPSASVAEALAVIKTPCLVTTADHALLKPAWIQEFLFKSQKTGADLTAGVALKTTVERDVPETKRTYIRLADKEFSGCNLFWIGTSTGLNVVKLWEHLQQHRKHPLRIAWKLGIGTLLKAAFHLLDSKGLLKRIYVLTDAKVVLIELSEGQAAVDVDKPADYYLVKSLLGG